MADIHEKLEQLIGTVKTERDELRVKLHLLKADARDEWEELEDKWKYLEPKLKQLGEDAIETGSAAATQMAEEIRQGYRRVRDKLR